MVDLLSTVVVVLLETLLVLEEVKILLFTLGKKFLFNEFMVRHIHVLEGRLLFMIVTLFDVFRNL